VARRRLDDSTPGACCLGFEEGTECGPAGIADALGQVTVAYQVGDPQVFESDRVVQQEQRQRGLVVKVGALPLHRLLSPLEVAYSLAAALAALLALRDAARCLLQLPLRIAVGAWVRYDCPSGGDEEDLQPHVDAGLASGSGYGRGRDIGTGEAHRVAVGLPTDGDGLGRALQGTLQQTATRPILDSTRYPLSSRAPLPNSV